MRLPDCFTCADTGLCPRCQQATRERTQRDTELVGLRATVRALEVVALRAADPLSARMCRNALEGRYPTEERAA